ncbi:17009_t:CDS:2, partial [Gigaspora margarita]
YNPWKFTLRSFSQTTTNRKILPSVKKVKEWKQVDVLKYLQSIKDELDLSDKYIDIIKEQEISGPELLKLTEEKLEDFGIPYGPAMRIVDFTQKFGRKLRAFSDFKTKDDQKSVLNKYGVAEIYDLPPFKPEMVKIEDNNINFQRCLDTIKSRIDNMGPLIAHKEVVHSKYVDLILQESLQIAKQLTKKPIRLYPELEIIGIEASGDVDYAFRLSKMMSNLKELVCITETKRDKEDIGIIQNIVQLESAFHSNKRQKGNSYKEDYYDYIYGIMTTAKEWVFIMYTPENVHVSKIYVIELGIEALIDDSELRKEVKKVMETVVGLLKDRVEVDDSFDSKKKNVKKILSKIDMYDTLAK